MKTRPTIFLSEVSHEFGSFRDAVQGEVLMKGCYPQNQPGFPPDYRTVEEMLRRKLHEADAVIHIVGFRFGAEPNERPNGNPRRSYTQMEFDIAREMQKPVYVFLSAMASVRQPPDPNERPEEAEAESLQLAHRKAVQSTNQLYYFFKDKAELCRLVAEIPIVAQASEFKPDLSRILKYAPAELIGRAADLSVLSVAWENVRKATTPRPHLLTFVALGGEGKTSLVAKWAAELAAQDWPGCDAAFAWSFYSQGTREQLAASSDLFLKESLTFFGDDADKAFAASPAGAFEKGQRLARIVGQRRSLLILDGLEPLQYAPTSPTPGQLKDQGIAALLKGLATTSHGLCVVTTRYSLPDLKAFWQTTAPEVKLLRLSRDAGVHLLKTLGVNGTAKEFETLVEDVKGHALTLTLLGTYLRDAHGGDIRKRDLVKLDEADAESDHPHHAFHVMDAYVKWFESGGAPSIARPESQATPLPSDARRSGELAQRALAILRLLGLFDRPATTDCLDALCGGEAIPGLTEPLVGLNDAQRNKALSRLEAAKLLTVNRDASGALVSLDAHPHLREYFARQLRTQQPEAWRAAHRRLYEHLCATTADKPQPTLEDLQPLYQAVAHGCQAGLQQEAREKVYRDRIQRRQDFYSTRRLGAFGTDLGAVSCFFEQPWSRISPVLTETDQYFLLTGAAFRLRALGRLTEAIEPMRAGLKIIIKNEDWRNAAIAARELSMLNSSLGDVESAVRYAEQSVNYADQSGEPDEQELERIVHGEALHQAGRRAEAEARFGQAEQMQAGNRPDSPLLYALQGFQYCDLLLASPERAAWQICVAADGSPPQISPTGSTALKQTDGGGHLTAATPLLDSCRAVSQRAATALEIVLNGSRNLLDIALNHLTLGRAALYAAILERSAAFTPLQRPNESAAPNDDERRSDLKVALQTARRELDATVAGLRRAGTTHWIPAGLLTRAWFRFLTSAHTGPESAQEDLDEAWEIAERGPMKLFLADIHLHRARLFGTRNAEFGVRNEKYPWESPAADLAAAEKLINACGYHRRDQELADAKQAILGS